MIFYALTDISKLNDGDTVILREKIKKHFVKSETLKRKESVAAKALLCKLLEAQFGLTDFTVDCDKNGKPFIVGSEICFNLSHSGNYALCALGDEKVGCDIQQIKEYNSRVVKRFFTENEFDCLEKCDEKALAFTRLWTLKESALKFSGEGISGGLDRYDFSGYYNDGSFTLNGLCFNTLELTGYAMSVCSQKGTISQLDVDIKDITNKDFLNERGTL